MNNESAIKFYEKFGFEIVEKKQNYYKRIEPADAFVLQKTFRPTKTSGTPSNTGRLESTYADSQINGDVTPSISPSSQLDNTNTCNLEQENHAS